MSARTAIRFALSLSVFLLFMLHASGCAPIRLLTQVEAMTYDARTLLTLPGTGDPRVVILDIDEKSIAVEGQWPWGRDRLAQLVNILFERYRIGVLGFDIAFAEADRRSGLELVQRLARGPLADLPAFVARAPELSRQLDNDRAFADAIRGKAVVTGIVFKPSVPPGEPKTTGAICAPVLDKTEASLYAVDFVAAEGYIGSVPALQAATPLCGFFDNPRLDPDGVFRRVPLVQQYEGALYPSLALALVHAALGNPPISLEFEPEDRRTSLNLERLRIGELTVPVDQEVAAYIPYRGPYRTMSYVSAGDVLAEKADPALLEKAIVIMGTSAAGLLDFRTTPTDKIYAGVEVHANLVSGMLDGRVRQLAPYYIGIETTMLLLIALLVAWLFPRLSPLAGAAMGLGILVAIVGLGLFLWSGADFIMPMGVPITFTFVLFMTHLLYGYFVESRGKREISKLFGQYVPPQLVEEMAAHPEAISMEGESREMSVLFSDVRGFTSISEKLAAKELSALMNIFLTQQTGVIQKHRGTIDKYMGDAIMAFWGAPLADAAHAQNAVEAGMRMCRAVRELDEDFVRRGWPRLSIGVGINSGRMNVGNMGSEFRMAYTVMGDAVNLGSRVEALTKEYGAPLICTEFTRALVSSDWAFRELDQVRVKGRSEPVAIYEPLGPKDQLDPALRQDLARHRGAMKLYRAQMWDQAEAEFFNLKNSGRPHRVYDVLLDRVQYLRNNPPGKDWDGVFTFTHK